MQFEQLDGHSQYFTGFSAQDFNYLVKNQITALKHVIKIPSFSFFYCINRDFMSSFTIKMAFELVWHLLLVLTTIQFIWNLLQFLKILIKIRKRKELYFLRLLKNQHRLCHFLSTIIYTDQYGLLTVTIDISWELKKSKSSQNIKRSSLPSHFLVLLYSHHIIVQIEFFILFCLNGHLVLGVALQLIETILCLVGLHRLAGFVLLYRERANILMRFIPIFNPIILFLGVHGLIDCRCIRILQPLLYNSQFLYQVGFYLPHSYLLALYLFHFRLISRYELSILISQLKSFIFDALSFHSILFQIVVCFFSLFHCLYFEISHLDSHFLLLFTQQSFLFKQLLFNFHFVFKNAFLLLSQSLFFSLSSFIQLVLSLGKFQFAFLQYSLSIINQLFLMLELSLQVFHIFP